VGRSTLRGNRGEVGHFTFGGKRGEVGHVTLRETGERRDILP
jgi:hypothetical protein